MCLSLFLYYIWFKKSFDFSTKSSQCKYTICKSKYLLQQTVSIYIKFRRTWSKINRDFFSLTPFFSSITGPEPAIALRVTFDIFCRNYRREVRPRTWFFTNLLNFDNEKLGNYNWKFYKSLMVIDLHQFYKQSQYFFYIYSIQVIIVI